MRILDIQSFGESVGMPVSDQQQAVVDKVVVAYLRQVARQAKDFSDAGVPIDQAVSAIIAIDLAKAFL